VCVVGVEHGCKGTCVKLWGDITGDDNDKFNAHWNNTISGHQYQLRKLQYDNYSLN